MSPPMTRVEGKNINPSPRVAISPDFAQSQHSLPLHRVYVHEVWRPVKRHRQPILQEFEGGERVSSDHLCG